MRQTLTKILFDKYPNQFKNIKYIECGDGWYEIINRCCSVIQYRLDLLQKQEKSLDFYWSQIKEKFGLLRMYCYGADEYMSGAIDMAVSMSGCICEYSGNKGKLYNKKLKNGELVLAWIKTLSLEEAINEGYYVGEIQNDN